MEKICETRTNRWRRMVRATFALCLCITQAFYSGAQKSASSKPSDTIVFKNGDRVTGKIIQLTRDSIAFRGNSTGSLTPNWTDVDHLTVASKLPVHESANGRVLGGGDDLTSPETASSMLDGTVLPINLARSDFTAPQGSIKQPSAKWGGSVQTQDNLIHSTQKQAQLGGTVRVGRQSTSQSRFENQATMFDSQAIYNDSRKPGSSPVITSLFSGGLQHNVYLTNRGNLYTYALANAYHNSSLGLDVEQEYGGGIGLKGGARRQTYGFAADMRFLDESLKTAPSLRSPAAGLTENYMCRFPFPKKGSVIVFEEKVLTLIPLNDSHAFQARGFAQVLVPLNEKFSVGVQLVDDFLRNAPKTSKENYSNTQYTLKYNFGAAPK